MSNAAHEPRRWTLVGGASEHGLRVFVAAKQSAPCYAAPGEEVPVIEASAYDALLAERDALKDSLAMEREQVEIGATARNELHNEVQAYMKEKRAEIDALKAELAALKEKAERLHHIATSYLVELYIASDQFHCLSCRVTWMNGGEKPLHAPDCPAHPDFLTTSATESREAKGGDA